MDPSHFKKDPVGSQNHISKSNSQKNQDLNDLFWACQALEPVGEKMCGSLLICIEAFSCTEVPSCKWRFPHVSSLKWGFLPNYPSPGPFEYPMMTTGDSPRNNSAQGPSLCPEPRSPWFWFIWVLKMGKHVCIPPNCMLFAENDVKLVNHFFLGPYFQTNPFWVVWNTLDLMFSLDFCHNNNNPCLPSTYHSCVSQEPIQELHFISLKRHDIFHMAP